MKVNLSLRYRREALSSASSIDTGSDGPGDPPYVRKRNFKTGPLSLYLGHFVTFAFRVSNETTINTMNPSGIVTIPGWLKGTQAINSASLAV